MSEATRAVSKTGGAKDLKIERYDQIPAGPLAELAARYGVGSLKYEQVNGLDNWRNGYPWSWSYRALLGHANAFWAGEDIDPAAYAGTDDERAIIDGVPRPGTRHLAAVAWHAFALLHWAESHPELDDRESTVLARQRAGVAPTEDEDDFDWNPVMGEPDPETAEGISTLAGRSVTVQVTGAPLETIALMTGYSVDELRATHTVEEGKVYPLLELDDPVELRLPDAPVRTGVISGIRKVDGQIRYDVNYDTAYYGLCGQVNRATFVKPEQITKL